MLEGMEILLAWERDERDSWNPVLADGLRARGAGVSEVHDLDGLRRLDLRRFDLCLPRFRVAAAHMAYLDEILVLSGIPMLNSRASRVACENKALTHAAFDVAGVEQPPTLVLGREGHADREPSWDGETLVKPLDGCRGAGIEILPTLTEALRRGRERREDLIVQRMIWPARSWRVIVGCRSGAIDPYWRRPPDAAGRVLSISTGSTIARDPVPAAVESTALEMLAAVDGDLLAADVLENDGVAWALEINHNFDAHGGDEPAIEAFAREIVAKVAAGYASDGAMVVGQG